MSKSRWIKNEQSGDFKKWCDETEGAIPEHYRWIDSSLDMGDVKSSFTTENPVTLNIILDITFSITIK